LGKSQYPDPSLNGTMEEFRIYNGALDALQIAIDAATGPDQIVTNPGALTNLTITAASPMTQFSIEQSTVTAQFANVANPVNGTTRPQSPLPQHKAEYGFRRGGGCDHGDRAGSRLDHRAEHPGREKFCQHHGRPAAARLAPSLQPEQRWQ